MRQLHTREQSGSNLANLGHADTNTQRVASYRLHVGTYPMEIDSETRQPRAITPDELSDHELQAQIELLAAQHERMELNAREGIAAAQETHLREKVAFQPKLSALIAQVERSAQELSGDLVQVDLTDAIKSMHKAAETLRANYFSALVLSDLYPRAPLSLVLALNGCRKEQRQRQAGKQAEVEKLRSQLAALGIGV